MVETYITRALKLFIDEEEGHELTEDELEVKIDFIIRLYYNKEA